MGITKELGGRLHLQIFSPTEKNRVAKRALISYGFVHSTVGCREEERGFVRKFHIFNVPEIVILLYLLWVRRQ